MSNQILTMKGYDLYEVISAFQKSIRRGLEKESMFWGIELHESGFANHAWRRLQIMSTEDVGLANPIAPVIINSLHDQYNKLFSPNDKKAQHRLPFTQAILYLVHSKKSRHTDWALNYHFDTHLLESLPMPDWALDIHTRRGKQIGRNLRYFFDVGSKIENAVELPNEKFYKDECDRRWHDQEWNKSALAEKERRTKKVKKSPDLFNQ